jgi:malonyl-CoA O-methyltransferase
MSIADAFGRAADYDRHAAIQRTVAERLADRIAALSLPPAPRVLEIGCGTGLLGAELVDRLTGAHWHMTDLSPAMIERARQRFAGRPDIAFATMDGEAPHIAGPFDLIVSSLAFQWFADFPGAIERLGARLAPGGYLAFTTMAAGSFAEWRAAHDGLVPGTPDYPGVEALSAIGLEVTTETLPVHHRDARDFLHAVKAIGAGTPRPGHKPLTPAQIHAVMRRFEQDGAIASYVVATCVLRAPGEQARA